jgi:hypothetical protein
MSNSSDNIMSNSSDNIMSNSSDNIMSNSSDNIMSNSSDNIMSNSSDIKIVLNSITSYKLQDLQNLMSKYGISTQKESATGKMKNKTKKECYDELIALKL